MVVDNRRIYYYCCPNCEWRILNNQIKDISGFEDKIHFCEYCGSKLEKINFENSDDIEGTKSEIENSIEYPVEMIARDPDFQIGFIDNLTLVLSRMIYFNIRYLEKTLGKKFDNIELDLQLLNLLSGALMPILQNDIEEVFLNKLYQITPTDFYSNLAILHTKVKSFIIFRQRFIVYIRWLVKQVFILVSESWNKGIIDKFEAIIFRDLNSYDFSKIQSKRGGLETKDTVLVTNKSPITNSFRGKLYHKARDVVYDYITKNSTKSIDFDSDTILEELLNTIGIPSSNEKIDSSNINYKNEAKERLGNKKKYISILGKIMLNILDSTKNNSITDISNKYGVSRDFVTKAAKFLELKHKIKLADRFPTTSARGSNSYPSSKTLDSIFEFCSRFVDSQLLSQLASEIFKDLVEISPQLTVDDLPQGYKTKIRYLAVSIVYFSLRQRVYSRTHKKYESYGVMKFIKEYFPNDTTMKLAITNMIPLIYNYLSDYQKINILYKPRAVKEKIDIQGFKEELLRLKEKYSDENRPDNIILIEIFLETISHYKKEDFQQFREEISFWTKSSMLWRVIKRLSSSQTLYLKSDLDNFIIGFKKLVNKISIDKSAKIKLFTLIQDFKLMRYSYYDYDNASGKTKRQREYERYLTYGEHYFLPNIRIKRFLLMLGFSPYDGFDIWENIGRYNGKLKIYANFHHYHYKAEDDSEDDLVFIPVKPPKDQRSEIYDNNHFLTHNMIAGYEGHLKSKRVSVESKNKIKQELAKIEKRIDVNSKLIKESVLTLQVQMLDNLIGWSADNIKKAKLRLIDANFEWAKKIDQFIPLTKEYSEKDIDPTLTSLVINEILKDRKKII